MAYSSEKTFCRSPDPDRLDAWVRQVHEGSDDAFEQLVFCVERELRIFISVRAASLDMVDEVLQNTLVTCFENIHRYELRGTFISWLKGIARNHVLRALRERARTLDVEPDALGRMVLERRMEETGRETDESAWNMEAALIERMEICIRRLPARARSMLAQRYKNCTPIKRMARNFKQNADVLAGQLKRIRRTLKLCIETAETAL